MSIRILFLGVWIVWSAIISYEHQNLKRTKEKSLFHKVVDRIQSFLRHFRIFSPIYFDRITKKKSDFPSFTRSLFSSNSFRNLSVSPPLIESNHFFKIYYIICSFLLFQLALWWTTIDLLGKICDWIFTKL